MLHFCERFLPVRGRHNKKIPFTVFLQGIIAIPCNACLFISYRSFQPAVVKIKQSFKKSCRLFTAIGKIPCNAYFFMPFIKSGFISNELFLGLVPTVNNRENNTCDTRYLGYLDLWNLLRRATSRSIR